MPRSIPSSTPAPTAAPFDIHVLPDGTGVFRRLGDADRLTLSNLVLSALQQHGFDPRHPEYSRNQVYQVIRNQELPSGKTVDAALRAGPTGAHGEVSEAVKIILRASHRREQLLTELAAVDRIGQIPRIERPAPRMGRVDPNAIVHWGNSSL